MTLDQVLDSVRAESTKIDSLAVLLSGIKRQLDDTLSGVVLPEAVHAKVDAIWTKIDANRKKIQDAIDYVPPHTAGKLIGVSNIGTTGNVYIDAVLCGISWAFDKLPGEITFSFPQQASFYVGDFGSIVSEAQNGFRAVNPTQAAAIRQILAHYASVCGLIFREITETATEHATLRYGYSAVPSTAWGYYPSTSAMGGDIWLGTSHGWYDWIIKGSYAWQTIVHETGHALGLKHPHDTGGVNAIMPLDRDDLEYTVMSYRSYINASVTGGYSNEPYGYPQTLMMYDMAGLHAMYGANYRVKSNSYRVSETSGELFVDGVGQGAPGGNRVFMTLWDGGGQDTLNVQNYPGAQINLGPGMYSILAAGQRANLGGGQMARGNLFNALRFNNNPASDIETVLL